jgi:3-oxoacyl-[acyl-carrier protein] reductase
VIRLDRRVAIVTGGSRGIGKAIAEVFREAGAQVVTWSITGRGADRKVDIASASEVQSAVDAAVEQFGTIDILVNNAGVTRDGQLVRLKEGQLIGHLSEEDWDAVVDVNLKGTFLCTQAVAPVMIRKGHGRIINCSSVVGTYGNFGQSSYVATKTGVVGLSRVWARELGPRGITVNVVAPGFIDTEMVRAVPEKVLASIIEQVPVRRLGTAREVALAYLYLASDDAAFVNGAVLSIDGGLVLGT